MGIISDTLKLNGVDKLYFFPDSLAIGTIDKFEYLVDGHIEFTWRPNDGFLFSGIVVPLTVDNDLITADNTVITADQTEYVA